MKINDIIKVKRIAKNLTQEQIAMHLGVSTPAVNKWEKGISYPDITILPSLARLLDTDLNTLLSFQDDLSDQEVVMFLNDIAKNENKERFEVIYDKVLKKINEFPNCFNLILSAAMILDGQLALDKLSDERKDQLRTEIESLYERVLTCNDQKIVSQAQSMLIYRYIDRNEYKKAEELLKQLPEKNPVDKKRIQSKLFIAYDQLIDAARSEEERLMYLANEMQTCLYSLLDIALKDKRFEDAQYIADTSKKYVEVLDLWEYGAHVAHFELYTKTKKKAKCLIELGLMLKSITKKWDLNTSPLYAHIKTKPMDADFPSQMKKNILESIEKDDDTKFLKDDLQFQELKDCSHSSKQGEDA